MQRFKSILVAVSPAALSDSSSVILAEELASLLEGAGRIRAAAEGSITLMSVLGEDDVSDAQAAGHLHSRVAPQLPGIEVSVVVRRGKPSLELIREVLRGGHDLLAVGALPHHRGPSIVGSTATQLIRECPCPVWVASRHPKPIGPRTVLSAVALHELSPTVLGISASLVALRGGAWHVLHVPEYPAEGGMRLRGVEAEEVAAYEKECRDAAFAELHKLVDPLAESTGVKPKLWMAEGRPSEQIAEAEKRLGADLVVMGTIGRGGLAGMIIGNTAERAIERLESSVLTIKPKDFECPVSLED